MIVIVATVEWVSEFWFEIICGDICICKWYFSVRQCLKKSIKKKERKMVFCRKDTYKYRGLAHHKDLELKVWIYFWILGYCLKILTPLILKYFWKFIVLWYSELFSSNFNRFVCLYCLCCYFWYFFEVIYIFYDSIYL